MRYMVPLGSGTLSLLDQRLICAQNVLFQQTRQITSSFQSQLKWRRMKAKLLETEGRKVVPDSHMLSKDVKSTTEDFSDVKRHHL